MKSEKRKVKSEKLRSSKQAVDKVYLCKRQSVLLRPSKRNLAAVETALCRRRNVLSSVALENGGV